VRAGRELAFVLLLVIVALVLLLGALLARRLTRSLKLLTRAAEQFAQGHNAPLPQSSIGEVRQLSTTFDLMRSRLRERTTERDQLYDAERQARAEAEAAVQTRDVFLSIAAHELKTPLTSLSGNAQLLQRRWTRAGADERDLRAVGVIVQQARRLNQLLGMLLDLSRIQTGRLGIEPAWFDLAALVERVIEDAQPTAPQHRLVYDGPHAPLTAWGDVLRLEQVVQNLVQNAVKYSPNGGTVQVRLAAHDDSAVLSVADHGIGIPPDALPNIFTRFYRAENADQHALSGFGIGLYVVKEIMTLHGGTINVESLPGVGTTFTVQLPLTPRDQPADLSLADAR
jgi:signal transduction histidine kinase